MVDPIIDIVNRVLNDDAQYARRPLELRNQRTYAVKVEIVDCDPVHKALLTFSDSLV
jgi:hypothetical protein